MRAAVKSQTLWIFVLAFSCVADPVSGHAPYERFWAAVVDADGRQLHIVAKYVDGIIAADPVTVTVRTAEGVVIAEAETARDAIVRCPSFDSCLVYLYDPPLGFFPHRVLRLTSSGFVAEPAFRHALVGAVLPVRYNFPLLLFESTSLAIVPLLAQILGGRRRTIVVKVAWVVLVPIAVLWSFIWWFGMMLNTLFSFVWLALAVGFLSAVPVVIRLLRGRPPASALPVSN